MIINGYNLIGELKTNNSGFSRWGYAKKEGKEYFIKEFLQPVYPEDTRLLTPEQIARKRKSCQMFEYKQSILYKQLNKCSDGSLVRVEHFFRQGTKYYMVMEKMENETWKSMSGFPMDDRIRMCKVLIHGIGNMHEAGLVHGDLKPDNILLHRTMTGHITVKVIDFDDCFWNVTPPAPTDEIHGDMLYLAPETFHMMAEEKGKLTSAIDVFALGLIIYQILTGELPYYNREKYAYPFEVLINGENFVCDGSKIPDPFKLILARMLVADPKKRISLKEAEELLSPSHIMCSKKTEKEEYEKGKLYINIKKDSISESDDKWFKPMGDL